MCSSSSHCDGQCARSSLRHTVMVGVHKNARDNVSTIYVLNYCTHLLMVRDRRYRNISLSLFYLRKSKSQNTRFPFDQLSSVQNEGKSKAQNA